VKGTPTGEKGGGTGIQSTESGGGNIQEEYKFKRYSTKIHNGPEGPYKEAVPLEKTEEKEEVNP